MAELYDPNERFRSGLNTLAQSFIAGMQAKQQKEAADREFQFRQEQAQAEAERQAKAQAAQQAILAYQTGLKGIEAGQAPEDVDRFTRAMAPQFYPDVISQKPVGEILPPQQLPTVRPPMQAPATDEQRNALQQLQVLGERLNSIDNLPAPENIKSNLREYLTGQLRQYQDVAFGTPSSMSTGEVRSRWPGEFTVEQAPPGVIPLETRPRGESFIGAKPLPLRPAGAVEQRASAPSLFRAAPEKPLKPSEDPLLQTQKEIELNFRSGRMAPAEMEKYYKLKSEYNRTNDRNVFLQGLQTLKFRERPVAATAGTAEQRAKFNLLLGYQDFVHTTEMDNDRIEDNKRSKQKEIADIQKELGVLEIARSAGMLAPKDYTERKTEITKRMDKANDEIRALELKTVKNLKQAQSITKSMNQLEKEVGLSGEFEAEQATDVRTERARSFLDEQGYESDDESIKMFLENNPDFE